MIPFNHRHAIKLLAHRHFVAETQQEAVAQYLHTALERRQFTVQFQESPRKYECARKVIRWALDKARHIRAATGATWRDVYLETDG